MQRTKNIRLLTLFVVLTGAIVAVNFLGQEKGGLDIDKRMFTLNPETVITDVSIIAKDGSMTNEFSYVNQGWTVNNKYSMDRSMRDVFFSVLSQMEIRRPIEPGLADSVSRELMSQGYQVTISNNGDLVKEYLIGGNEEEVLSVAMGPDNKVYEVHIPGYQSYVAGIFGVPENDWRDRFIFRLNPVSLAFVEMRFQDEKYRIEYDNNEFRLVDGIADSTELANFMESVIFLQADSYFDPGNRPEFASQLNNSVPELTISVGDITGNTEELKLFPKEADGSVIVGLVDDHNPVLFNARRISRIYRRKDSF